ncbi:MAG TPA: hypothetical protein VGD91_24940 [Trebonia sp.]
MAEDTAREAMSEERLRDIRSRAKMLCVCANPKCHRVHDNALDIPELLAEVDRLRAQLAEMIRCRDNAMSYAERQHVPIQLDDEIDINGEVLADRIEGELLGPGWDWDDDRTPGLLARTAVAMIRPHLARLTDQAQKARAQLAEIGETTVEWGLRLSTHHAADAKSYGRGDVGRWEARAAQQHWHTLVRRSAGDWRDVEEADHA